MLSVPPRRGRVPVEQYGARLGPIFFDYLVST